MTYMFKLLQYSTAHVQIVTIFFCSCSKGSTSSSYVQIVTILQCGKRAHVLQRERGGVGVGCNGAEVEGSEHVSRDMTLECHVTHAAAAPEAQPGEHLGPG